MLNCQIQKTTTFFFSGVSWVWLNLDLSPAFLDTHRLGFRIPIPIIKVMHKEPKRKKKRPKRRPAKRLPENWPKKRKSARVIILWCFQEYFPPLPSIHFQTDDHRRTYNYATNYSTHTYLIYGPKKHKYTSFHNFPFPFYEGYLTKYGWLWMIVY